MSKPTTDSPPRLVRFRVTAQYPGEGPSWHNLNVVDATNPPPALVGWSILVRGAAVFFVSPRGWTQGAPGNGKGDARIIEIPRSDVMLVWAHEDALAAVNGVQRIDIGPLERKSTPSGDAAMAIDPKELGDA